MKKFYIFSVLIISASFLSVITSLAMSAAATDVWYLVRRNDTKAIKKAIESNPDLLNEKSFNGSTLLGLAALCNKPETVQLLIDLGANINNAENNDRITPLRYALRHNASRVTTILLENRAWIFSGDLHCAATNNSHQNIKQLVNYGADVNEKDEKGKTPLMLAQAANKPLNVRALKKCGATE